MLRAKNIIYGFCTFTNPPKNKYLISLYRSETLHVVAVFPTYGLSSSYAIFYCHFLYFLKKTIRQDMALWKKSDDLF